MTDDPSTSRTGRGTSPYIPVGAEVGPYRVEAYLDRGGMAFVYEATDLRLNRTVALKVLAQEVSDECGFSRAVHPRVPFRRVVGSSKYRPDLRGRRGGRAPLYRDALRAGWQPG